MKDKYPYLTDPRALAEIRRHKWLESQKAGREVGFATAAVDWIRAYGAEWKDIHAAEIRDRDIFIERRKYRRFKLRGLVKLVTDGAAVLVEPLNVSFFGMLCRTPVSVPEGVTIKARMSVDVAQGRKDLDCYGSVERVVASDSKYFDLFFSFNECCQEQFERTVALSYL